MFWPSHCSTHYFHVLLSSDGSICQRVERAVSLDLRFSIMAPKYVGGRGANQAQDYVDQLCKRGFDKEKIRAHLKAEGYKPSRICQLLKVKFGPAKAIARDACKPSTLESKQDIPVGCGNPLTSECTIDGGCRQHMAW